MNEGLYKAELRSGVETLLPFARKNTMNAARWMAELKATGGRIRDERVHWFPPYQLVFTLKRDAGCEVALLSVSAPMRPVKRLSAAERDWTVEAFSDLFRGDRVSQVGGRLLKDTSAFKVYAIPAAASREVDEGWADARRWARSAPA